MDNNAHGIWLVCVVVSSNDENSTETTNVTKGATGMKAPSKDSGTRANRHTNVAANKWARTDTDVHQNGNSHMSTHAHIQAQ